MRNEKREEGRGKREKGGKRKAFNLEADSKLNGRD